MRKSKIVILIAMTLCIVGCAKADDTQPKASDAVTQEVVQDEEQNATQEPSPESRQPYVLQFSAVTSTGEEFTSDRLADSKLTMINVWGTFCGACLNEMPELGEIASEYDAAEFQLIGIVSDVKEGADQQKLEGLAELIDEIGANYPHLLLNGELYGNLVGASEYVPTTYFFNQNAELLTYVVGSKSKEQWVSIIEQLLKML